MVQTLAALPTRRHEVVLDHPILETSRLRVHLPPDLQAPPLPPALDRPGPAGARFGLSARQDGAVVEWNQRLQLPSRRIPVADYPALRSWLAEMDAALRREHTWSKPGR